MLTSPLAVREISRYPVLAEQGRLIVFGVPLLTLRHIWRPWTSFRLGWGFSSLGVCMRRNSRIVSRVAGPVIILCALPGFAAAQTWGGTGGDDLWNNAANWIANGVPASTGTAIFGSGAPTSISTFGGAQVGALQFNAPGYIFETLGMNINGAGVDATSTNAPTFNVIGGPHGVGTPTMVFNGTSSAGTAQIVLGQPVDTNGGFNAGFLHFENSSTAGQATITTRDASNTEFHNTSTAGTATIIGDPGGSIFFENASSADHATITMLPGSSELSFAPAFFGEPGGTATAGDATIINGATTNFFEGSSAGNATITNSGTVNFFNTSSADNATITSSGLIEFHDQSSAGNATFNTHFGVTNFFDTSTAGNAAFTVIEGNMNFNNNSSGGTATIIAGRPVSENGGFDAGFIMFHDNSTADHATISSLDGSSVEFHDSSTADHATLIVGESGFLEFVDSSSGDQARVINNAGGEVKIADLTTGGTSFGSIEGAGTFNLGSKQLTVGSNGLSTTVSGIIEDRFPGGGGGAGGSLVKVGMGTLTIDGAGTYTGGRPSARAHWWLAISPTRLPPCQAAVLLPWGQAAPSVVMAASLET